MMTFHSALWHSILEYVSFDKLKFSCIFWHSILDDNVTFCMIKYDSSWYSILNDNILFWSKELKEKSESTSLVFWRCFKKPFNEKSLLSHLLVLHSIGRTLYCAVKQSVILYKVSFFPMWPFSYSCRHCSNIWPSCTQYRQEKAWFDRRLVMFERSNFTVILKRNMSDKGVSFKLRFYLRFNRFYDSLCSCKSCISPKTGSGIILIWCSIKLPISRRHALWSVLSRILFVFILHFSLSLNGNFWIWIFMSASMLNSSKCYNSSIALQHSWRKSPYAFNV